MSREFKKFQDPDGTERFYFACSVCHGTNVNRGEECGCCVGGHEPAIDALRHMVNWFDVANESVNQRIPTVEGLYRVWCVAMASNWDVYADDFPKEAIDAAVEGRHDDALKMLDAWMTHAEYHGRKNTQAGCPHCMRVVIHEEEASP